jgi:DNA helicase IV
MLEILKRNEDFVQREIKKYSELFSSLERFPLSEEQMRAAIINEDCNLLIAAAGSGKSATVVAKVIYLIKSGLARPADILVLTYNKNAQQDIQERLNKGLDTHCVNKPVEAKTFHGLASAIVTQVKVKPSITKYSTSSKSQTIRLFSELIERLRRQNSKFANLWCFYLLSAKRPNPDFDQIRTRKEYVKYLRDMGAKWKEISNSSQKELVLQTIDNVDVKSMEEVKIANWLVTQGVKYKYEMRVKPDTATQKYRQYYPDFYYPEIDLYHEHFALNSEGKAPSFMRDYEAGVEWKRFFHAEKEHKFIETTSAQFSDGSIFLQLTASLREYGVRFNPPSPQELDQLVEKAFNPETDIDLFTAFLRHFKANQVDFKMLKTKAEGIADQSRASIFLDLFELFYKSYNDELNESDEIDFEDLINFATKGIEENQYRHSFKYILVDEFQDMSQDRKFFLKALLDQGQGVRLFAVGDDWQSIYGFSCADIDIMTRFEEHFGKTVTSLLTQTFRSYGGVVSVASVFVQKNPSQLRKTIRAHEDIDLNQVIIQTFKSKKDQYFRLEKLLCGINKKAKSKKTRLSVFILGRYNNNEPPKIEKYQTQNSDIDIEFNSIHASKGLEADYVFVLDVIEDRYGFPSAISNDPILGLVFPRPETYPNASERRLMYVALTRAKRAVYLFALESKASTFLRELSEIDGVKAPEELIRQNPCPRCDTGEIIKRHGKYGEFESCNNYPDCIYPKKANDQFSHNVY